MIKKIGLIKKAVSVKESGRFAVRKGMHINELEIRRSPIMNMIISSYRCVRVLRLTSVF